MLEALQVVCVWLELHGLGVPGLHKAGFWVVGTAHVQAVQSRVGRKLEQNKHQRQSPRSALSRLQGICLI